MQPLLMIATVSLLSAVLVPSSLIQAASSIQDELTDIQEALPMDQLEQLMAEYLVRDNQFRRTVRYMRGSEFADLWEQFEEVAKVKKMKDFMTSAGFPVSDVLETVKDILVGKKQPKIPKRKINKPQNGGLTAFAEEALNIISSSEAVDLHKEKVRSNPDYKSMTKKLQSDEFQTILQDAFNDSKVKSLRKKILNHGIDINLLSNMIKSYIDWND
ncbi:protein G12-like [Uranotaenia lowii]|uniref:protein G12-like n=1 Tax=Uranotaenia lowii TaxID=190385 RepID=UPI0024789F1A|nr:protein G12-like [Uranotaenia lowii]